MRSEIDTYEAGRELDALIAKEVFGLTVEGNAEPGFWVTVSSLKVDGFERSQWRSLPRYSTDESDAFQIVKYLCQDDREPNELYFKLVYGWFPSHDRPYLVRAIFDRRGSIDTVSLFQGLADTIPLAICRAALRVVREDLSLPEVPR